MDKGIQLERRTLESRYSRSNSSKTSLLGWWIDAITVRPSLDSLRSICVTKNAETLSRPLVGSSKKSSRDLIKISNAMLTRLFSPPLIPRKCQLPITMSAQSSIGINYLWCLATGAHASPRCCGRSSIGHEGDIAESRGEFENSERKRRGLTFNSINHSRRLQGSVVSPIGRGQKRASDEAEAAKNITERVDLRDAPSEDSPVVDGVVFDPLPEGTLGTDGVAGEVGVEPDGVEGVDGVSGAAGATAGPAAPAEFN